jgi:hypothetical protein
MRSGALQQGGLQLTAGKFVTALAASFVLWGVMTGVQAQDLDAGKSGQQLFSSTCTACHRGPQGLAKGRSLGAIAGFLSQHYTSGKRSAGELGSYLASVGGDKPAPARGAPGEKPAGQKPQREAAKPPATREPGNRKQNAATPAGPDAQGKPPASRPAAEQRRAAAPAVAPRRPRRAGEPATVSTDPDPVIVSIEPVPLVHDRASSRAQEQRAPAPSLPPSRTAALPASGPDHPASATPADSGGTAANGAAGATGSTSTAPAGAMGVAETAPVAAALSGGAEPVAGTEISEQSAQARQLFSSPLP